MDDAYHEELLRRQDALQAEAGRVMADLDIPEAFGRVGRVEHIGSSAAGLMVWRDIDINILGPHATAARAFDAVRPLLAHPRVTRLHYANETGARSPSGRPDDERYYYVVYYETEAGDEWKIDLSLWVSDAPRTQLAQLEDLARRLTDETRLAILWIKDVWRTLPTYPYEVGGVDVYDAVLEHGVRTPAEFDTYLRERGLPGR